LPELMFLKLGGSLITDKQRAQTARHDVIQRVADEVKGALDEYAGLRLVLGHGSGSFGHPVAERYGIRGGLAERGDWWGYAETAVVAARLNRLVADTFLAARVPVLPLQPSASALCRDGHLVHLDFAPLEEALRKGLVPLVYGDVSFDTVRGSTIISTEEIFAYLAPHLEPSQVILATEVDGVFTRDPLRDPGARLVREISASGLSTVEAMLNGSLTTDVTGGMLGKVQTMCRLVQDIPALVVRIVSGARSGLIKAALLDKAIEQGTLIHI
jgi:isopentenyl phosphate kinase